MTKPIEFYFDFAAPYGFLAAMQIDALPRPITWRPFLLGAVYKTFGQSPVDHPLKRDYVTRVDAPRMGRRIGLDLGWSAGADLRSAAVGSRAGGPHGAGSERWHTIVVPPETFGVGVRDLVAKLKTYRYEGERRLRLIADYVQSKECRSVFLRRYFGEEHRPRCGTCDRCRADGVAAATEASPSRKRRSGSERRNHHRLQIPAKSARH